jgi:HlyD family secretion protein
LLKAQDDFRSANSGGRADEAARVTGDLAKAVAERDRLQRNHDALQRLLAQQAATKDELSSNELELAKAQAEVTRLTAAKREFERTVHLSSGVSNLQIQQAQNEVAALEEKVRDARITAPIDGTLYSFPARQGDFVKAGDLLAEMADLHKVRVRAFVDEPEIGSLAPGQPVRITWDALPSRSWQGLTEIIPKQVVTRGTRSVGELLCSVNNDNLELLPNVNVSVRINSKEAKNVLVVPRGTVATENGKRYVFVVKSGLGKKVLEKREIQVGIADANHYEVVSGLDSKDLIALPSDLELQDGMRVKIVNTESVFIQGHQDGQ